jgi:hypothetical protein
MMGNNNMNRTIKFRIWHKGRKDFLKPNEYSLHCFTQYALDPFTGKLDSYIGEFTDHHKCFSCDCEPKYYQDGINIIKESPYVLQQYTGYFDVKGIEICEGDIVKTYDIGIAKVVYGRYLDKSALGHLGFYLENKECYRGLDGSLEIGGNIFENLEMLDN